ncbi:MAG: GGDEF-domain containing protein, partial [Actinoplanes sp.]
MTARLFVTLALVLGAVALGEIIGPDGWRLYDDAAQLVAGAAAAVICLRAARGRTGIQRRWRLLVGAGLCTWTLFRLWWVVQDLLLPDRPATAVTDVGFLLLPLSLLLALLSAPYTRPRPVPTSPRRDQIALIIDSVLIAGSVLALIYSAVPDQVLHRAGQTPLLIGVAAAYPIADLILLTMVLLLLLTRPDSPAGRAPLAYAGLAVLSFGVTD